MLALAAALALFVALGAVDLLVGTIQGRTITPEAADAISGTLGAAIGVVATFVGLRGRGGPQ